MYWINYINYLHRWYIFFELFALNTLLFTTSERSNYLWLQIALKLWLWVYTEATLPLNYDFYELTRGPVHIFMCRWGPTSLPQLGPDRGWASGGGFGLWEVSQAHPWWKGQAGWGERPWEVWGGQSGSWSVQLAAAVCVRATHRSGQSGRSVVPVAWQIDR